MPSAELYFCLNCQRDHCNHPLFEVVSSKVSRPKKGISTTIKCHPQTPTKINRNIDLELKPKTSTQSTWCNSSSTK